MPRVVVDIERVRFWTRKAQGLAGLAGPEVYEEDQVDAAHEIASPIVRQKRAYRQGRGVDLERAETGHKIGQRHERAHMRTVAAGPGVWQWIEESFTRTEDGNGSSTTPVGAHVSWSRGRSAASSPAPDVRPDTSMLTNANSYDPPQSFWRQVPEVSARPPALILDVSVLILSGT
jgi:hypothetical protein